MSGKPFERGKNVIVYKLHHWFDRCIQNSTLLWPSIIRVYKIHHGFERTICKFHMWFKADIQK